MAKLSAKILCSVLRLLMKHIRLFLSVLFLILMVVPAQAQKIDPKEKIDTKVYYYLSAGTVDEELLSISEVQPGKYALSLKEQPNEVKELSLLWRFVDVGNGFFRLINASQPNMSVDVINDSITNDRLVLAKTADVIGQHWKLSPLFDGFRLTNRWQAGKCIAVGGESARKVLLGKNEDGTSFQRFAFFKSDIKVEGKTDVAAKEKFEL